MQYSVISCEDNSVITVVIPGDPNSPYALDSSQANFSAIRSLCGDIDDLQKDNVEPFQSLIALQELLSLPRTIEKRFERLSQRVTVRDGEIEFDGDPMDNSLTKEILRYVNDDEDFQPFVNFFEKLMNNPSADSREQFYDWIAAADLTVLPNGDFVGYKAVRRANDTTLADWTSCNTSGWAYVNDERYDGAIPQIMGGVVTLPRNKVVFDPAVSCSFGLHVGTWYYAKSGPMSGDAVLEVHVNPVDVVSVPRDHKGAKIRCCRYEVVDVVDRPHNVAVLGGVKASS